MADVTKINGYIIKDANAPHPSNAGSAGQVLKKTETGTEWADASFKPAGKSYLTFSSPNSFTLKVNDTTKHWDGILEYFSSNRTWTTWDGTATLSSVADDREYVLYLRGTGNTVIAGNSQNYRWILTGSNIACIGNIENLLDYATVESGNHPTMANDCYGNMFELCTALTQAPTLPATTLAIGCYYRMFYGCTALTQAPTLPATTLTDYCYNSMFQSCTALTQAPTLPATTLATRCYQYMFELCTALTQAPTLPATTLATGCYQYMFRGCAALTQAPTLPATTLADACYSNMFRDCTSITKLPALPATTLAGLCYSSMFYDCTSLKLSSTKTGEYTQEYRIPSSGTGTTATNALADMFASTGGTFTGTPEINTTYYLSSDNMVVHETEVATLREYVGSMIDSITPDDLGAASKPSTIKVTLSAASWDSTAKTQTVTATGVLADETAQLIQPTPALASQTAYYEAGILCTGQAADSLTFTATTVPTKNLTVYVIIQDVVPPPQPVMINFSLVTVADDIVGTYQAEAGMTWSDWVNSEYNTDGYELRSSVPTGGGYSLLDNASSPYVVLPTDHADEIKVVNCCGENVIIEGNAYIRVLCNSEPGPI